jgi:carbon monoxide dehydrogenase subunit G
MPAQVELTRAIVVNAPPASVFPLLSDFKQGWSRWNAFDDEDPAIAYAFEGPERGTGAVQSWTSKKIGDGKMTLTSADSLKGIGFRMEMGPEGRDFRRTGMLAMEAEGAGTRITWTDSADMGKGATKRLMGPVLAKMMGLSMEKSLAGIKRIAEATPASTSTSAAPADTASSPASRE